MGYQALLFCPEEKLARVVSQVFSELDFTIEPVHEPFAAVKKLMTQRYDAIVVDCENEQNASLLFKSARNSSSNQSSLAIALVEGQAGVAKAYRIGANLVLTKPINVEQAKGTLRVARGLLRKNSDAASAAATGAPATAIPAKTAPVSDRNSFQPLSRSTAAIAPPSSPIELPELDAPLPAMAASAEPLLDFSSEEDKPAAVFAPTAHNHVTSAPEPVLQAQQSAAPNVIKSVTENDAVKKDTSTADAANIISASVPTQNIAPAVTSFSGSAAATAPAKEAAALPATIQPAKEKETKSLELEPANPSFSKPSQDASYGATPTFGSLGTSNAPTFGALGDEDSSGSGGNKKIVIAAAAILALAGLGYLTYGKLGHSSTAPVPQSVSAPSERQPPPTLAPMSSPASSSSTITVDRASVTTQPAVPKTPAAALLNKLLNKSTTDAGNPPVIHIADDAEPATKKSDAAPILVKTNPVNAKPRSQTLAEESAPALAVVPANDSSLNGLMSSVAPNLPKPSLATLKISQGVSQGLLITKVQPKYPQTALAVHAQGAVQIEATINKDGSVINPKVLSGDPILGRAALEAVRQWRYKPYYLDGQPVEIQTQITINFKAN